MKYHYFVLTTKEKNNKLWARIERISENQNIKCLFNYENILHLNICSSKKQAEKIRDSWNDSYKNNGTYYFSF